MQLLEESGVLPDLGFGDGFSDMIPKAGTTATREKSTNWTPSNLVPLGHCRESKKKMTHGVGENIYDPRTCK